MTMGGDPERWFVGKRVIQAQYDEARALGGDVVQRLLELGYIDERAARQFDAMRMGIAFVDLERIQINFAATLCLSSDLAREIGVLPLKLDGNTLYAAFRDVRDQNALRRAEEASGYRVIPIMAMPEPFERALNRP